MGFSWCYPCYSKLYFPKSTLFFNTLLIPSDSLHQYLSFLHIFQAFCLFWFCQLCSCPLFPVQILAATGLFPYADAKYVGIGSQKEFSHLWWQNNCLDLLSQPLTCWNKSSIAWRSISLWFWWDFKWHQACTTYLGKIQSWFFAMERCQAFLRKHFLT